MMETAFVLNHQHQTTSILFSDDSSNNNSLSQIIISSTNKNNENYSVENNETDAPLWYRYDLVTGTSLVVAYSLVFIAGLVGNVLVLVAVFSGGRSMRHSVTNIFLANLAVADLLVIIACLPFTLISNLIYPWVLGATICKLLPFLQGVSVFASVYSLVAVAVERCRSITSPLNQRMNPRMCRIVIALIWILALIITSPWIFVFKQNFVIGREDFLFCIEVWPEPWMEAVYFFVAHLTLCYIVPLFSIILSYVLVSYRICIRLIPGGSQLSVEVEGHTRQMRSAKIRSLRMVAIVVAAFAFTWLPFYIVFTRIQLANAFVYWKISTELDKNILPFAIPIAQWMSSANSCINPFLYHFLDPRFRYRFQQMLLCRRRSQL